MATISGRGNPTTPFFPCDIALKLAYINDELKIFSGEDPGLSSFKGVNGRVEVVSAGELSNLYIK